MKPSLRLIIGTLSLILLGFSVWQIVSAGNGLNILHTQRNDVPITIVIPKNRAQNDLPVVLIGHGFAGSSVIMRGFAFPLAYAGYAAVLWDFDGHGRNPHSLAVSNSGGDLLENAETALAGTLSLGIGDASQIAILGHSMGSGVAMNFGQQNPDTKATIAVSPVGTMVTPELPHNLLLLAGENEPSFVQNAELRLEEAGGPGGDFREGTARKMQIIPWVEHITIVFSSTAHQAAVDWLNAAFGIQPGAVDYKDRRIIWYGLGISSVLLAALCFIPPTQPAQVPVRSLVRRLLALVGGGIGATLLLRLAEAAGVNLTGSFGLIVGGYLLVWFALAGILALLILGQWRLWFTPSWREISMGILTAAVLWLGIGLLGGQIWLPWLLISARLFIWPLASLLMLPWFLAVGLVCTPRNGWKRAGWWVVESTCILGSLFLAVRISEGLFFLVLILPVFPILLAAHAMAAGRQRAPWAFGIGAALFTSWAVLAVFPLQ